MIIRTERSALGRGVDILLTALAWGGFAYLLLAGVLKIAAGTLSGPRWDLEWFATVGTLLVYVLVAGFNALVLIAWAWYNQKRFRNKERRSATAELKGRRLIEYFNISKETFEQLQANKRTVIHHDEHGAIIAVDTDTARKAGSPPA